ncbi:ABC transporter permease [Microbacterium sp. Clip185]|uniref:ABC transporter permease n=1 Tax=Microbacterium sp. Clip185 TaxID=3025663 RepID=UPI0023650EC6|nr:ABC transporter permease [Microbacterium sp. Clip185]WDG17961.1 ABC transporter permease [Microbacterium sp. Clip185]
MSTLVSPAMYRIEGLRQLRNPYTLAFTLAMPFAMYLLFGASMDYASQSVGHANASFYVMVSMGAYGTATAMSSLCSLAASEVGQGWGRQLALTPLSTAGYALTKVLSAMSFAALSVLIVYIAGYVTGAAADDVWRWFASAAITLVLGLVYGLFGLGVGLAFNSDSAAALASISITFFGFFGNVFVPLSGVMLDIAKWTPMYGYAALVRWPATGGALVAGGSDQLWAVVLNVLVWGALFALLVRFGVVRSRRRR